MSIEDRTDVEKPVEDLYRGEISQNMQDLSLISADGALFVGKRALVWFKPLNPEDLLEFARLT